jgi:FlaG/FlaF family flagellin (archaellin)
MKKLLPLFTLLIFLSGCSLFSKEIILTAGDDNIQVGETYSPESCLLDTGFQELEMNIINSTVDTNKVGEYKVEYSLTHNDETFTCTRYVYVNDNTPPEITLNIGLDTIYVNDDWVDASALLTDNYSKKIDLETTSTVDTTKSGSYTVTYTATDEFGNTSSMIRYVTVLENENHSN